MQVSPKVSGLQKWPSFSKCSIHFALFQEDNPLVEREQEKCYNKVKKILQKEIATGHESDTAQKMKFSIKDFFSKCDQIRRKLQICSHLLKKCLIENFVFFAVRSNIHRASWVAKRCKH